MVFCASIPAPSHTQCGGEGLCVWGGRDRSKAQLDGGATWLHADIELNMCKCIKLYLVIPSCNTKFNTLNAASYI